MHSAIRARREQESGFTLIELLVVVIIIGILAAIAIPAFLGQRERAWQAELVSAVRNAALEIESDATALGGAYPATAAGDAAAQAYVDANINTAGAPITNVVYTESATIGTGFQLCMTHGLINLVGVVPTNNVTYAGGSEGNGLQPFAEAIC